MAARMKKNNKLTRRGRRVLRAFGALALLLALIVGACAVRATRVNVRRAEVWLDDLPAAFDGTTLLYASDIDLVGWNNAERAAALFDELARLEPDLLLLGGDYTSPTLPEFLDRGGSAASAARQVAAREGFFRALADFPAPLGRFAIASPSDPDPDGLAALMRENGVTPLFNDRAAVTRDGQTLWVAGISADSGSYRAASGMFKKGDCVVAMAYSPDVFPSIMIAEASGGGPWADLVLAGGTHGGQLWLFGRSLLPLTSLERQRLSGWSEQDGLLTLVTTGVGCELVNLRGGSNGEVWLLTLRKGLRE